MKPVLSGIVVAAALLLCGCAEFLGTALPPVIHTTVEQCAKLMNAKGRPDLAQLCLAEEAALDKLLARLLVEVEKSKKTQTCK